MKRVLFLVAVAAMASVAGPLKVGGDLSGVLNIPSFDPDNGVSAKVGFGVKAAPAVEYAINDKVSVRGNVGYELTTYSADIGDGDSYTIDFTTHLLTLDVVGQYAVTPQILVGAGLGYDINLSSKAKAFGVEADDDNKANPFVIEATAGYLFTPSVGVMVGYQFPITGISDGDGTTIKVMKVTAGLRYNMEL